MTMVFPSDSREIIVPISLSVVVVDAESPLLRAIIVPESEPLIRVVPVSSSSSSSSSSS